VSSLLGGPSGAVPPSLPGPASPEAVLRSMLELANVYRQVEQDDEDLQEMEQVTTRLQGLLARNSKEADAAAAGKLSPRLLRQAYGA
jgi:hypothetical protein